MGLVVPHLDVVRMGAVDILVDRGGLISTPQGVGQALVQTQGTHMLSQPVEISAVGELGGDLEVLVLVHHVLELRVPQGGGGVEEHLPSVSPGHVEPKGLGDKAKPVIGGPLVAGGNNGAGEHRLGDLPPGGRGVGNLDMEAVVGLKINLELEGGEVNAVVLAP